MRVPAHELLSSCAALLGALLSVSAVALADPATTPSSVHVDVSFSPDAIIDGQSSAFQWSAGSTTATGACYVTGVPGAGTGLSGKVSGFAPHATTIEEDASVPRCYLRDSFGLVFNVGKVRIPPISGHHSGVMPGHHSGACRTTLAPMSGRGRWVVNVSAARRSVNSFSKSYF